MGKKAKVGKSRKDKFYHLAKETGYRARSAFKLIQLNRKFGFLQESRVLLDLCAAPGGWLQVASKFMPMSSIILGVDLVSIKPIKNVVAFQADITTDQCKQLIKKEIKTWKIDVVLNDGAPNVGSAWVQDAFSQAQLALSALKLASEFLRKGGWFVTKVFRSKDYAALLWVFQQLFKKVHSTKPQASRNESAEIFVVCQGYLAPDKLDEKFLDPKHVFKEVQETSKVRLNILHPEKTTRQREGYPDNNITCITRVKASLFVHSKDAIELLSTANSIEQDDEKIREHLLTTAEVLECCQDIKVLGKREIKLLFSWRKKLRLDFRLDDEAEKKLEDGDETEEKTEPKTEEETLDEMVAELNEMEQKDMKKKKRKVRGDKKKLRERLASKLGASVEASEEMDLFSLNDMKSKKDLDAVESTDGVDADGINDDDDDSEDEEESEQEDEDDEEKYIYGDDELYEKRTKVKDDVDEGLQDRKKRKKKNRRDDTENSENPLLMREAEEKEEQATEDVTSRAALWYQKDVFKDIESDADDEYDMENLLNKNTKKPAVDTAADVDRSDGEDDDSDTDSGVDSEVDDRSVAQQPTDGVKKVKGGAFEIAPQEKAVGYLDAEALALGTAMKTSRKRKRDIIDDSYHRYSYGVETLPKWFEEDESRHKQRPLPITKEEVEMYKQRQREINARPIKKVIEAKAKKKDKMLKKLEKVRKRAEGVLDAADTSTKEKQNEIKGLYKRAGLMKKKREKVTYVVAKKSQAGRNYKRPDGIKGQFKVVDPRLKKDLRAAKTKEKTKGRGGKYKGKNR